MIEGKHVEQVLNFKYLGSTIKLWIHMATLNEGQRTEVKEGVECHRTAVSQNTNDDGHEINRYIHTNVLRTHILT